MFVIRILIGVVVGLFFLTATQVHAGQTTLLASAVRTATNTGDDIGKTTEKYITVILKITAVPGGDTVTPKIQGKDNLGNYYDILVGSAQAGTGTFVLRVGPGLATTANVSSGDMVPDIYRVVITHSAGTNFTYSVTLNTAQ